MFWFWIKEQVLILNLDFFLFSVLYLKTVSLKKKSLSDEYFQGEKINKISPLVRDSTLLNPRANDLFF